MRTRSIGDLFLDVADKAWRGVRLQPRCQLTETFHYPWPIAHAHSPYEYNNGVFQEWVELGQHRHERCPDGSYDCAHRGTYEERACYLAGCKHCRSSRAKHHRQNDPA